MIHGKGSTSLLLKAAVQAVDVRPGEIVTKDHAVATWRFNRLVCVLLDSPEHMTR